MSLDDFYIMPDWLIYDIWASVAESKYKERNALNHATSYIAYYVREYLRDNKKTEPLEPRNFLPYDLFKAVDGLTSKTARITVKLIDKSEIPPDFLRVVIDCGLMESIERLAKEE